MSLYVEYVQPRRVNMAPRMAVNSFRVWDAATYAVYKRTSIVKMTPLSGFVGYALRRAHLAVFADFSLALASLDLRPSQFAVLVLIDQNPGTSQSMVSAALGIQKANFVATIADLQQRGIVRRRKSGSDGRTYSLELTRSGRSLLQRASELHSVHEARLTAQLGSSGRSNLLDLLDRLAQLPCGGQCKVGT